MTDDGRGANAEVALATVSTEQLEAEMRRRRRSVVPAAAGRCANCGEEWFFRGRFSPAAFERQFEAFRRAHAGCTPAIDGGGI